MPQGLEVRLGAERALPELGSDYAFGRLEAKVRYGLRLPFGIHLALEARGGIILGEAEGIPFAERYRLGGTLQEVYGLPALGPFGPGGGQPLPLGGTVMALARGELRIPLIRSVGLYLFGGLVAGALSSPTNKIGSGQVCWNAAATVGLLWLSPIGPLRFGFSFPLIRHPDDPAFSFLFSTGIGF